jgi:hypothetical protein
MKRRERAEAVPLGALGYATEVEPLLVAHTHACGPHATVTDPDGTIRFEHLLGGWPALREARRVVRASIREGWDRVHALDERAKKAHLWSNLEARADESLKDSLSVGVPPKDGETEDEYDARLEAIFRSLRVRLDGLPPPSLLLPPPPPHGARTRVRQTSDKQLLPPRPAEKDAGWIWRRYAKALEERMRTTEGPDAAP